MRWNVTKTVSMAVAVTAVVILGAGPAAAGNRGGQKSPGPSGGANTTPTGVSLNAGNSGSGPGSPGGGGGRPQPCMSSSGPGFITYRDTLLSQDLHRFISGETRPGRFYREECNGDLLAVPFFPDRPPVDPAVLAAQAREFLPLAAPGINTSPPPGRDQLVNLATWLWLDASTFSTQTSTVGVPGVSVTVTAVPQNVKWDMGDGSTAVCNGPGTPYDPSRPAAAQSTDCSHTYRRSSAGQPGQVFRVTATTSYAVSSTVVGAPGGGPLPAVERSSSVSLRLAEGQAVNR